jgi:hypothetical protein
MSGEGMHRPRSNVDVRAIFELLIATLLDS